MTLDTKDGTENYEVMAAFNFNDSTSGRAIININNYVNIYDEDKFYEYVNKIKDLSMYDTGVDSVYGDKLITLITCSYHSNSGRFIVVARRS